MEISGNERSLFGAELLASTHALVLIALNTGSYEKVESTYNAQVLTGASNVAAVIGAIIVSSLNEISLVFLFATSAVH